MNRQQLIILWIAIFAIALLGLYPPWVETVWASGFRATLPVGHSFIFSPPEPATLESIQVDYGRLFVGWGIVTLVAAGAFVTMSERLGARREIQKSSASLGRIKSISSWLIVVIALAAGLLFLLGALKQTGVLGGGDSQQSQVSQPEMPYIPIGGSIPKSQVATQQPMIKVEVTGHGLVEFPDIMSQDEIRAVLRRKFGPPEPLQQQ